MATNCGLAHLEQYKWYLDCPNNKTPPNEQVLKEQFELGFSKSILPNVPPTKMKPNSNKKPTIASVLCHLKCKAIILDNDILENLEEPDIIIGQFDVEKPSTKEANVTSTTTMTFGLVGALGGKVGPIITTSMIPPLKTKCLM
jgi:hypothetical protein